VFYDSNVPVSTHFDSDQIKENPNSGNGNKLGQLVILFEITKEERKIEEVV
jgi:hypothetical protein